MAEKEYIEREALLSDFDAAVENNGMGYVVAQTLKRYVKRQPAADVATVRHGRWEDSGRYQFPSGAKAIRCSICGCALNESEYRLFNWNYCPVCGAKMDLEGGSSDERL